MTKNPKGIQVKFFKNSEIKYFLCPNCYEYLMIDECMECGLICDIENNPCKDSKKKDNSRVFREIILSNQH